MEMILCILLLMKGCMFYKYTPATLKKELGTRFFITDCTDFLPRNPIQSLHPWFI